MHYSANFDRMSASWLPHENCCKPWRDVRAGLRPSSRATAGGIRMKAFHVRSPSVEKPGPRAAHQRCQPVEMKSAADRLLRGLSRNERPFLCTGNSGRSIWPGHLQTLSPRLTA